MSSTARPNDLARLFGGAPPADTRGVLIERLIPAPGRRGGRRERVDYVPPEDGSSRLRGLTVGRYRVACIGSRGAIKGGARVVEARGDGSLPQAVPARTSRDYPRTPRARKKTRLRARLKTTRTRLEATTRAKRGAGRKVRRRDAQIVRERADHARREKSLRAELRDARRSARVATRARDNAFAHAEEQERARAEAERKALAEAQARAAAEAEVQQLRAELQALHALRSVQGQPPARPAPPRRRRAVEAPPVPAIPYAKTEGSPPPQPTIPPVRPDEAPPRSGPSLDEERLRAQLAMREHMLSTSWQSVASLEDRLRHTIAQRDAAQAEATRRGVLLDWVTWCIGGAAALAVALHAGNTLRRTGAEARAGGDAAAGRPPSKGAVITAAGARVVVSHDASSLVGPQWSGPPIILRAGAGGSPGSAPS